MNRDMKGMPSNLTLADRHKAAAKLSAAFRGHKGRQEFHKEVRKVNAIRAQEEENRAEAERPKARTILRPQGKSYSGF